MMENLHTEFKEKWSDKWLRNIAALGNSDGGTLYIGWDDDGNVIGIDNVKNLLKTIPDKIQNVLGIVPSVNNHSKDGKDYISIKVAKHDDVLFYEGKLFVKSGSTTRELKGRELRTYFIKKFNMSWTDEPCPQITVEELDNVVFHQFKKEALKKNMMTQSEYDLSIKDLFKKLDLLIDGKPKLGAVLLFHPEPGRFTSAAYVKIGLFGADGSEILYQDLIEGPLFLAPNKVVDLIMTKYTTSPISFEGIIRTDNRPYPLEAIREAVLNSIIHSDYGTLTPIQIKVFPNRLTIFNDGSPPNDWTVETLLSSHRSHPGNPSMATVFYRAGMIESFGRGIEKIMNEYKGRDVKPPLFKFSEFEFNVTFFNENYQKIPMKTEKYSLSVVQSTLLTNMTSVEYSIVDLMSIMAMENRESFRRNVLRPLLEFNLIEMTMPDKPNSRYQKYRLTSKGLFKNKHPG